MTSAEVVVEYVKGRPRLESAVRVLATDTYKAPETVPTLVRELIMESFREVTAEEREKLDRMRGNGKVDWFDVARAFGFAGGKLS